MRAPSALARAQLQNRLQMEAGLTHVPLEMLLRSFRLRQKAVSLQHFVSSSHKVAAALLTQLPCACLLCRLRRCLRM